MVLEEYKSLNNRGILACGVRTSTSSYQGVVTDEFNTFEEFHRMLDLR
jgi:hypothetical protein